MRRIRVPNEPLVKEEPGGGLMDVFCFNLRSFTLNWLSLVSFCLLILRRTCRLSSLLVH